MKKMATSKNSKNCETLNCPGEKATQEILGLKPLVEKVLAEMSSLRDTLAGTMERPGLIHQVRELADSQRATAAAVEKLTEAVRELEQFKNGQIELNKLTKTGLESAVTKEEVQTRAETVGWVWKAGAVVFGAISGALSLLAAIKGFKP